MGPEIGSQMTLIGAVLGGLSSWCSDRVGRRRASVQWYAVRQSCFEPDKRCGWVRSTGGCVSGQDIGATTAAGDAAALYYTRQGDSERTTLPQWSE